jgi:hypothetical protein
MLKCVGCGKLTVDTCKGVTCGADPFCSECSDDGADVCEKCLAEMDDAIADTDADDDDDLDDGDDYDDDDDDDDDGDGAGWREADDDLDDEDA